MKDNIVHFILLVSFFMVRSVVEQGKCIKENIIKLIAVSIVQPLFTSISLREARLSYSINTPLFI